MDHSLNVRAATLPTALMLGAALVTLSGCATGAPAGTRAYMDRRGHLPFSPPSHPRPAAGFSAHRTPTLMPSGGRRQAVALARSLLGKKQIVLGNRRYRSDCAGLVEGVFSELGVPLKDLASRGDNAVTAIHRFARVHGRLYEGGWPVAGDLVFFKETYDQNRDGRVNDGLTHIGIVEEVLTDGTVKVIHRVSRGVVSTRMNVEHPKALRHPHTGEPINDALRQGGSRAAATLTGELFAGYASLLPSEGPVAQKDNRRSR